MGLRNGSSAYGAIAVLLHWISALLLFGLFALGLYMVGLDYYHPWRQDAPALHKSIGALFFLLTTLRLFWRWFDPPPPPPHHHPPFEVRLARWTHRLFYLLLFAIMISGYLIATADGRPLSVFGWFAVPAVISLDNLEDWAGTLHYTLALTILGLVCVHALAACKHHFVDGDGTLKRIFGIPPQC